MLDIYTRKKIEVVMFEILELEREMVGCQEQDDRYLTLRSYNLSEETLRLTNGGCSLAMKTIDFLNCKYRIGESMLFLGWARGNGKRVEFSELKYFQKYKNLSLILISMWCITHFI